MMSSPRIANSVTCGCGNQRLALIFEAGFGLRHLSRLLGRKISWQRMKKMAPASVSFAGQCCLAQPKPDRQIVKVGIRDGDDEPPGGVLVCPHLRQLYPFNLSPQEETLMIRTEERGAPPGPSLLDQGGANSNHQKLQLTSDSSCRVQHRHPE